ncbi:MAG: hypothetical protein LC676_08765, partial [Loktanella sp.]|nr:hypothetical protein [Loktanella sp.]
MTLMRSISKLTTSVDQLTGAANLTKAAIDAKVAEAHAEVISAEAEQTMTVAARDAAGIHATDAETHLATVKAGVTYGGIDAILAAKAVTAADVFVYDTSLDSDGGAWRKRCQHTSWFNEPLNTATRGARRAFPAVAVIIAEANRLTIYDGDDPALPMWMVFDTDNPSMLASSTAPKLASVVMRDGEMAVGSGYVYGGVSRIQFPADTAYRHRSITSTNNTQGKWMLGGIVDRHQNGGFNDDPNDAAWIVNEKINDIAMTVLPDAPCDPSKGLPVPTIAVGTDGGTSIIKHDGVVISDNTLSHTPSTPAMGFDADGVLWLVAAGNHLFRWAPPYDQFGASEINDYKPGAALAQWY